MSRYMGNGYHGETRPDEKMGQGMARERKSGKPRNFPWSSAQNAVRKHRASKKRRQRNEADRDQA